MQQRLGLRIVVTERVHCAVACLQNSVAGVANLPNRVPGAHGMLLDDEATQLETPAGGTKEEEMRGIIERMTEEEQAALVAIMWIGRDAFDAGEWGEAYATAMAEANTPTADYLLGTPHLADHLEAGLEALGFDAQDEEDALMRRGS